MDQEKIGKFIKDIRKKNNLTQKEFADKYGVTYQAVSKWENGKNIPDISLLNKMSKDFNINIEDILDGNVNSSNKRRFNKTSIFTIIGIGSIFIIAILFIIFSNKNDFEFKTISSNCSDFNISGSIAYNKDKSSIYISDVNYCGNEGNKKYVKIECSLYENDNNIMKKISTYKYEKNEEISIEKFFKNVKFNIDNYERSCKEYSSNSLFLIADATDDKNNVTVYKIPLSLEDNCLS